MINPFRYTGIEVFSPQGILYEAALRDLQPSRIREFVQQEAALRPECLDQLKFELKRYPEYHKYIKLLVLA